MALEKQVDLRRVSFVFTTGKIHPEVECLYEVIIKEDGKEISKTNHREIKSLNEMKILVGSAEEYQHPIEE